MAIEREVLLLNLIASRQALQRACKVALGRVEMLQVAKCWRYQDDPEPRDFSVIATARRK